MKTRELIDILEELDKFQKDCEIIIDTGVDYFRVKQVDITDEREITIQVD